MNTPNGIRCVVPIPIKLGIVLIAGLIAYYVIIQQLNNLPVAWILWAYTLIRIPFYSPDLTIYPHGIEIKRFGQTQLLAWEDIRSVRIGKLNSVVYPTYVHPVLKFFFYDSLLLNFWRTNYTEATELIGKHVTHAVKSYAKRAY